MSAVLVILFVASCGWKGTGVVIEKIYSEDYYYPSQQCISYNKDGMCTNYIWVQNYVPESFGYKVRDSKGEEHSVSTNKQDWETHKVGDKFDNRD